MINMLPWRFQKSFGPIRMLTVEGCLKQSFLDIYLTTFLVARNFQTT